MWTKVYSYGVCFSLFESVSFVSLCSKHSTMRAFELNTQTLYRNGGIHRLDSRQRCASLDRLTPLARMPRCLDTMYLLQDGVSLIAQDMTGTLR